MHIVVCGNYGVGNLGDEAILGGVRRVLAEAFPGCSIDVMGAGKLFPFGIRSFVKGIFRPSLWKTPYNMVKKADLFILGGGGLITDEERPFTAAFWLLQGILAQKMGRKTIALGISIGSLGRVSKVLLRRFMKNACLIGTRDGHSYSFLKQFGVPEGKLFNGTDLAISYPLTLKEKTSGDKYVVIIPRCWKNMSDTLYTIFAQFADSISATYAYNIKLLSLSENQQNDRIILNKIFERLTGKNRAEIVPKIEKVEEAVGIVHRAEFVLSMRLHGGIFSLLTGTPFLPISYMKKVGYFFESMPAIDLSELTLEKLIDTFELLKNTSAKNKEFINGLVQTNLNLTKKLRMLL